MLGGSALLVHTPLIFRLAGNGNRRAFRACFSEDQRGQPGRSNGEFSLSERGSAKRRQPGPPHGHLRAASGPRGLGSAPRGRAGRRRGRGAGLRGAGAEGSPAGRGRARAEPAPWRAGPGRDSGARAAPRRSRGKKGSGLSLGAARGCLQKELDALLLKGVQIKLGS